MPWVQVWEDAPHDESLEVLQSLPPGVSRLEASGDLHHAWGQTADGEWRSYHFCQHCGGWIPGNAYEVQENTLDSYHLAGRQGRVDYCRRCGREIAFSGIVS